MKSKQKKQLFPANCWLQSVKHYGHRNNLATGSIVTFTKANLLNIQNTSIRKFEMLFRSCSLQKDFINKAIKHFHCFRIVLKSWNKCKCKWRIHFQLLNFRVSDKRLRIKMNEIKSHFICGIIFTNCNNTPLLKLFQSKCMQICISLNC